jgi:IS30 family transposase
VKGYKHLTKRDRIAIENYLKIHMTKTQIAKEIGCSRSTINREIKRGLYDRNVDWNVEKHYSADIGQNIHDEKATTKGAPLKIGNDWDFVRYVEDKIINEKYSPDSIIGRIKVEGLNFSGMVSTRTLYNYIDSGVIFPHVTRESLLMKGKRIRKYDKVKPVRIKKPLVKSIEDRPKDILNRDCCGHWEMDTVYGKQGGDKSVLLVLTERKSRAEIIRKIPDRTIDSVVFELDKLERDIGCLFPKYFKTITMDNGSEFMDDKRLERSVIGGKRTTVYYCHPYCSSERGSNENANKLIRRFIPKGSDISQYSDSYITYIQEWINNYPRRILGYYTPLEDLRRDLGFVI